MRARTHARFKWCNPDHYARPLGDTMCTAWRAMLLCSARWLTCTNASAGTIRGAGASRKKLSAVVLDSAAAAAGAAFGGVAPGGGAAPGDATALLPAPPAAPAALLRGGDSGDVGGSTRHAATSSAATVARADVRGGDATFHGCVTMPTVARGFMRSRNDAGLGRGTEWSWYRPFISSSQVEK